MSPHRSPDTTAARIPESAGTLLDRIALAGWYIVLLRRFTDRPPLSWTCQLAHPSRSASSTGNGRTANDALAAAYEAARWVR